MSTTSPVKMHRAFGIAKAAPVIEEIPAHPTVVDARFAGGAVVVEQDAEYTGDDRRVVVLALPGHTVALFPHEARALAAALTAHANAASAAQR